MPLLEVKNLSVRYPVRGSLFQPRRYLHAINNISFSLEAGETIGLVGESGCGKSTLGKALVRLETPYSGEIKLSGSNILELSGKKLRQERRNFQMIFQDPYGSLNPRLTIGDILKEVLKLHFYLTPQELHERAEKLLERVGLDSGALNRYPHQFSGGQRQRIGIARALAPEPRFIVADEPVSALDVSVQAAIVNLLEDIQIKQHTAFLFISHDLAVVEHISRRIMVMYLGNLVEMAPAADLICNPLHPYTKALISAIPAVDRNRRKRIILNGDIPSPLNPPTGCPFHPRCPEARSECRQGVPPIKKSADGKRQCACLFADI